MGAKKKPTTGQLVQTQEGQLLLVRTRGRRTDVQAVSLVDPVLPAHQEQPEAGISLTLQLHVSAGTGRFMVVATAVFVALTGDLSAAGDLLGNGSRI